MTPENKGHSLLIVTIILLVLSIIVVFLRCIVRLKIKGFGLDDYLMGAAQVFFMGTCIAVILGCYAGIGMHGIDLTSRDRRNVKHAMLVFQCLYCVTLIFVKTSICCALLRLTICRRVIFFLYIIMFISVTSALIPMITVLVQCRPIQATWDGSAGRCTKTSVIVDLSYFVSACSILTDFSCSILPVHMLWNLQMKKSLKWTVSVILGLGLLASSATIVRLFYFDSYYAVEEYPYKVSDIVIWSIVESGIGICAGSAPALRPLLKRISLFGSSTGDSAKKISNMDLERGRSQSLLALVTIGGHISARCSRAPLRDDAESMKDLMRDEVLVTSEVTMDSLRRRE